MSKESHIILSVPFYGMYSGLLEATPGDSIRHSLLEYAGLSKDEAFDRQLPYNIFFESDFSFSEYMQKNYGADAFTVSSVADIQQYLSQGIPVAVQHRFSMDTPHGLHTVRLAVGFSDIEQKIFFHDHNFGPYFSLSYDQFDVLNTSMGAEGVVLKPQSFSKRNEEQGYSVEGDNAALNNFHKKWITIDWLSSQIKNKAIPAADAQQLLVECWNSILNNEIFDTLHPALRYLVYFNYGRFCTNVLQEHQKAAEVFLTGALLSETEDFAEPYNQWVAPDLSIHKPEVWLVGCWWGGGVASLRAGDIVEAESTFKKVLALDPTNEDAKSFFKGDYTFAK